MEHEFHWDRNQLDVSHTYSGYPIVLGSVRRVLDTLHNYELRRAYQPTTRHRHGDDDTRE
jgi:hypothetical protein